MEIQTWLWLKTIRQLRLFALHKSLKCKRERKGLWMLGTHEGHSPRPCHPPPKSAALLRERKTLAKPSACWALHNNLARKGFWSPLYRWENWCPERLLTCPREPSKCWKWSVSLSVVSWLFAILWTVARQAPLSMEFSRQEYWSGLPFPSPGDLSHPGIEPRDQTHVSCTGGRHFNLWTTREDSK